MLVLETARLDLIACDAEIARAAAALDRAALGELLDARVPDAWPHELIADHLDGLAQQYESGEMAVGWGPWYWVLNPTPPESQPGTAAPQGRVLIGNGGGGPLGESDAGTLIIGYAVLDEFHGNGYATEAMTAFLDWAFQHDGIERAAGDTYPRLTPSIRVMEKLGMKRSGSGMEPDTIRYTIERSVWRAAATG